MRKCGDHLTVCAEEKGFRRHPSPSLVVEGDAVHSNKRRDQLKLQVGYELEAIDQYAPTAFLGDF